MLGEVDGLAGEVGRGGVAVGRCGVAVDAEKLLLELDGADGGVDLERRVEAGVVGAGQVGEKLGGPGAAVAAVYGEAVVDLQGCAGRGGTTRLWRRRSRMSSSSLDAVEAFAVGDFVLMEEDLVRAFERAWDDELAALVIERRQDDRGGGLFFYGG